MAICPLSTDWGNVADWAAVVVGVGAALATTVVAVLAHRTSKRATEIADEATKIAGQQHGETVQLREANARILGRQLLYEVIALPARVGALLNRWEGSVALQPPQRIADGQMLIKTLDEAKLPLLPGAQRLEDRIHNLPNHLGADLATLIGGSQTLTELVRKIEARVVRPTTISGWGYRGNTEDFNLLHGQLLWLKEISTGLAEEFQEFVLKSESAEPDKLYGE